MKETLFIIFFGVLIYLGAATIFGESALMGSYGSVFAEYNHIYFGYVSYVYILAFLFPLYFTYKESSLNFRKAEVSLSVLLLLFSMLLAQALLVSDTLRGKIGSDFVDFLAPFIGVFGLWIFWFIITLVSVVIILDKSSSELAKIGATFMKRFAPNKDFFNFSPAVAPTPYKEAAPKKKEVAKKEEILKVETPKTEKKPLQATLFEEEIDKPSYLRNEDLHEQDNMTEIFEAPEVPKEEKKQTIIELAAKVKEQKNAIIIDELEENAKLLEGIEKGEVEKPKNFTLPSVDFLQMPDATSHSVDENEVDDKIRYLIEKLAHFKIDGDVVRTYAGPVVSTFEFKPAANVKVSKILNLQDDLAMALSAETIRIQAPIPGKDVVGIEIPNDTVDTIFLRDLLDSKLFKESKSPLTLALGKDIVGKPFITDLKKLPHLLIAGTTGSGKSVGINAMILSLLYKNSPDQLRLLMIDPKMLEFSIYNDIPHLLTPVITKAKQAIVALANMVMEMERRYELMSETRTKNIENYNEKIKRDGGEHLPYIVVIIDELADLMMTSGKEVEHSIGRLAQMARASGIHLIVATQRPSVDVVTGLIKANLPSRISYRVGQKVDSKIILDQQGAE
ncbi:MAG: DNA translocase FtsK 4TM domain-containing protein, partial [Sulfurimonas sp.]|nr:DNA translocase FtsK 4TM domain-containing protein [Sulfurimonas sp.]